MNGQQQLTVTIGLLLSTDEGARAHCTSATSGRAQQLLEADGMADSRRSTGKCLETQLTVENDVEIIIRGWSGILLNEFSKVVAKVLVSFISFVLSFI